MKSKLLTLLAALAVLAGALAGSAARAADEEPQGIKVLRPAAIGDTRIRFVHASPDTGAVDVYVGNDPNARRILANVPFGTVSDYLGIDPATEGRLRVVPTGQPLSAAIINEDRTFADGEDYTVAACVSGGSVAFCEAADQTSAPPAGQARLRLFHFAPDAPAPLDLRNTAAPDPLIIDDAERNVEPTPQNIAAGSYNLAVTNADGSETLATLSDVQLQAGKLYDLFAIGSGATFRLISSVTEPQAQVRFAHAVVGAPEVDVYVDGTAVLEDVPFFAVSDYLAIAPGSRQVGINLAGSSTPLIGPEPVTVAAGRSYTIAARGTASSPFSLDITWTLDDRTAPPAGRAKVRLFHLSPDTSPLLPRANNTALLLTPVSYPSASPYVEVPAGTYTFRAVTNTGAVAFSLPFLELEEGRIYDVFAVDQVARIRGEVRITDTAARVRFVHASPTASDVDVYVDDDRVLAGVQFQAIGDYLTVQPGLRRIRVVPAGANPDAVAAIDTTPTFEAGTFYTVAARNQASTIVASVFTDSAGVAADGRARVRVYHLSNTVQTLTPAGVDVLIAGGATLVDNLTLGNSSSLEVDAGTYDLVVATANGTPVAPLNDVVADARASYDLFAIDTEAEPTVITQRSFGQNIPIYDVILPLLYR